MPAHRPFANPALFPAAMVYGALILPWSVLALQGLLPAPPGLTTPGGHAHEMFFGYALAVVSGDLLGPQPVRWLPAMFRLFPGGWLTLLASGVFAALVVGKVMPRFLKYAKKWRHQTLARVVGVLALCELVVVARTLGPKEQVRQGYG